VKLQDYFKDGVITPLGYSPTSGSIKPVHVANGLFRAALGEYYDPRVLNKMLIRWANRGAEERHPTEELVDAAGARLGDLALSANHQRLNELRELLKGVLGADGAVFDKNENCSYTLTHRTHLTADHNDRGTGDFLFRLLKVDLGRGPSPVLELLRELLGESSDEISVLSLPLTAGEDATVYELDERDLPESLKVRSGAEGKVFRSPIVRELRAGFDTLATFERARGSKLHSLRRIVTFATFALIQHVVHRALDYEDGRQFRAARPPMLLDFVQGGWSSIAVASQGTYNLACKAIERMVGHGVRARLVEEHGERWTTRQVEQFVEEIELRGPEKAQERRRKHFSEVFKSYAAGGGTISDAFGHAIVDVLLEDLSGSPFDFMRALGVRGGLLAPRGQRAVKKRYAPSPELLEVLLASTLEHEEEVELEQLADRWRDRFGIVTGALPTDARDLARCSILDATKEDLAGNAEALRAMLIEIGYARRYADGVTVIRLGHKGAA
jgi:hypothetical protein